MLKKQNIRISGRKKSDLKNTPGEVVRDSIIKAGMKAAGIVDGGTTLAGGTESASAIGRIAFKTTRDIARDDTICTGLCLISGTCETVALGCSTLKGLPLRGPIYVGAKIISRGCIAFQNACANEGC